MIKSYVLVYYIYNYIYKIKNYLTKNPTKRNSSQTKDRKNPTCNKRISLWVLDKSDLTVLIGGFFEMKILATCQPGKKM